MYTYFREIADKMHI